jgi:hypothetical protein
MMKKLLVLVLILAFTSAASALPTTAWLEVDGGGTSFDVGTVITVNLLADDLVSGFKLDILAADGILVGLAGVHPDLNVATTYGTPSGDGTKLVGIGGTTFTNPVPAGTAICWVTLEIPDLAPSTLITVDNDPEGYCLIQNVLDDVTPVELHIAPEPMTVVLLGIGGLFLRRRK